MSYKVQVDIELQILILILCPRRVIGKFEKKNCPFSCRRHYFLDKCHKDRFTSFVYWFSRETIKNKETELISKYYLQLGSMFSKIFVVFFFTFVIYTTWTSSQTATMHSRKHRLNHRNWGTLLVTACSMLFLVYQMKKLNNALPLNIISQSLFETVAYLKLLVQLRTSWKNIVTVENYLVTFRTIKSCIQFPGRKMYNSFPFLSDKLRQKRYSRFCLNLSLIYCP